MSVRRQNPGELQIDLFCRGLRLPDVRGLGEAARPIMRTRAGLGSGLELVIPGDLKDVWLNVPVEEDFVRESPFTLLPPGQSVESPGPGSDGWRVLDGRNQQQYPVRIPDEPSWYAAPTTSGTPMAQVGVLQGTYLGIYVSNACMYWYSDEAQNCRFCTTGFNVGVNEVAQKDLEEVVETALRAKEESGVTFVHFNTGYQNGRGLKQLAPYVKAIKERVGALVGVQAVPPKDKGDLWQYDWLRDLGCDHFSFCYEFHHPEWFAKLCPGKEATVGQQAFFNALEYCQSKMPKGACSGEIIAGVEPLESSIEAIDWITDRGAFPTVCIFRPVVGSDMEHYPSPQYDDMVKVMRHMYLACRKQGIPIGAAPNIEVSLIVNPDDAQYLVPRNMGFHFDRMKLGLIKKLAGLHFRKELRPHPVKGDLGFRPPHEAKVVAAVAKSSS